MLKISRLALAFAVMMLGLLTVSIAVSAAPTSPNAAGQLDTLFSGDGKTTLNLYIPASATGNAVALQGDNILIAGFADSDGQTGFGLLRLLPNDQPDTSFGNQGHIFVDLSDQNDIANAIAVQPDGKIVLAGLMAQSTTSGAFAVVRLNADGTIDNSFGTGGKVTVPFNGLGDAAYAVAIRDDGKIVVAGTSGASNTLGENGRAMAAIRLLSNGALDTSFDGDGKVTVAPGFGGGHGANDLLLLPDGKVVLGGYLGFSFGLVRLNENGTMDTNFGDHGLVFHSFDDGSARIYALARQSDGKIVAAGSASANSSDVWALARYTPDGILDPGFGGDGKVTSDLSFNVDTAYSLAIQPDGKIVAGGMAYGISNSTANQDFAVERYLPNGSLDSGFGEGGVQINDLSNGQLDYAYDTVLLPNGKILLAGSSFTNRGNSYALAQYTAAGDLDTTFADNGQALIKALQSAADSANAVAVQADGKIVVAGGSGIGVTQSQSFSLARYNANGTLDTSFGSNGTIQTRFENPDVLEGSVASISALAIGGDGKIVAAGSALIGNGFSPMVARYTADGQLDPSFGNGGVLDASQLVYGFANALLIQPDGKIVVGGQDNSQFQLLRYLSNGTLDPNFGTGGTLTTRFPDFYTSSLYGLALAPGNKIIAIGSADKYNSETQSYERSWALARFNSDGTLDSSFDGDGQVLTDMNNYGTAYSVLVQPDGKIVAGGGSGNSADLSLARYNSDGSLDSSFDGDGKVMVPVNVVGLGYSIALQDDGKLILVGYAGGNVNYPENDSDFVVLRVNANGSPDSTFGPGGLRYTDFGNSSDDVAKAVAIDSDSRLVVAGYTTVGNNTDIAIARYLGDRVPAATATRTSTVTNTLVNTLTATRTPSATSTAMNTATTTRTATRTASATASATQTLTVVSTPSRTATAVPCTINFSDVSSSDYFYTPVQYLYCTGVISGYSDNTFRPFGSTTRSQLAKIVVGAEGWAIDTSSGPHFADVPADHPFYAVVETAVAHGVVSGYNDAAACAPVDAPCFKPYNNVTRGQLSKIIVQAEGWAVLDPSTPTFVDVPRTNPFYKEIETAVAHGLISGYDLADASGREFRWQLGATRAQISKIVYLAVTGTAK